MKSTLGFIMKNRIAVLLSLSVSLAANAAQPMRMDDATFLGTFTSHGKDLWSWAQEYWVTWSGRILPHGLFMLLLSFSPELVNIINAVMITLALILSCVWIFRGREESTFTESFALCLLTFTLYILTPTDILDVTVFWKTASVLYIWGFAAMLYALTPFMAILPEKPYSARTSHQASRQMLSILSNAAASVILPAAALYCAGFETSGSFFSAFGGFLIILAFMTGRNSNLSRRLCVYWLLVTAAFFICISAPGNIVRFKEEALFWFPNYGLMHFTDKLFLGTAYTLGACLHEMYLPMIALSAVIFMSVLVNRKGIVLTLTALWPLLYYGLYPFAGESSIYAFVCNDVYGFYTAANWFATFLGILALTVTAVLIFIGVRDEPDFTDTLFFCGGIAEQIVMGFTPTVAVSISRSSFFSRELLMIPLGVLLLDLVSALRERNNLQIIKIKM